MGETMSRGNLSMLRKLLFFILCHVIVSLLFLTNVSQADLSGKEKTPAEIFKEYGDAVVFITAYKNNTVLGEGSGFIVDPKGVIITNYHCIEGSSTVKVRLTNGAYYDVEGALGVDKDWDVAVLMVNAKNLPSAPLGDSDKLSVGERVVAIGNPLGLENTVSEGIISAIRGFEDNGDVVIQFTAPISPGSSGGPLFNTKGEVIGVTTLYLKEGQNLNFAVPINLVKPLLKGKKLVALAEATREARTVSPSGEAVDPEALRHSNLGDSFFSEGKFDSAIREYQEAIRLQPDYAKAHLMLGWLYWFKDLYGLTIRHCEEAVRLDPRLADAAAVHLMLGNAYSVKDQYDLAIRHYEETIRLEPDYAEAYWGLGTAYGNMGQYDLAIKQWQEAIRLKPDYAEAHLKLGAAYSIKGQYDLAMRHAKEAMRIKPDSKDARELLNSLKGMK